MKCEAEVKELLISNAINLISEGGFERATTKELTYYGGSLPSLKMNEVYIYRIFGSKEKVYEAAFIRLATELFNAVRDAIRDSDDFGGDVQDWFYNFFVNAWDFALGNEARCRCYVRYYFSVYFKGYSREVHNKLFGEIVREITPLFKDEANVTAIMQSVFMLFFDIVIRVYNGDIVDNEETRRQVFNGLYGILSLYFK